MTLLSASSRFASTAGIELCLPREADATTRAGAEHRAGRALGRALIRRLTGAAGDVRRGHGGEPVFPDGLVGSLAHSDGLVAVRAGRAQDGVRAVGIDVVSTAACTAGLPTEVATHHELRRAADFAGPELAPLLLFSIKESVFKAWHPSAGTWLEFRDVLVRLRPNGTVAITSPRPVRRERWAGAWSIEGGFIRTAVVLRAPTSTPEIR